MTSECDDRDNIVGGAFPDFNGLTNHALKLIQTHIYPNAKRVNPSQAVTLALSQPHREHTISPSEMVFEIDKIDLDNKLDIDTTGYKGCYIREEGQMYLCKGNWCIETIIHETLHACSRESESDELDKYYPFFEGLTEFYTGFILFREYQSCYENCFRTDIRRLCQITYEELTKLWVAFCNFVPLSITTCLYFNDNNSWGDTVTKFVKKVNELGFTNFKNPFSKGKLSTDQKFAIQCNNSFPEEFNKICASRTRYTDFSRVLQD